MDQQRVEEIRSVALGYADAGIVVIPVHPAIPGDEKSGKNPKPSKWQERRPTLEQVDRDFSRPSNLGVVCGAASKFICIDVDAKHGGLAWYYEHDDGRLGSFLLEHTGGGGYHLFYRYPSALSFVPSPKVLAPGVEVKADGGFQVVTWPSIHNSGVEYRFEYGLSLLDLEAEADEPPQWLLDAILDAAAKREVPALPPGPAAGFTDSPQDVERALRFANRHRGAGDGSRNNTAFKVAAIGRDCGLSPKVWWPHVVAWGETCVPPCPSADLMPILKNAYRYAKGAAGARSVTADFPDDLSANGGVDNREPAPRLSPAEAAAQADELGANSYPHTNPVLSARRFLGTIADYCYGLERHHVYADDCWRVVEDDYLSAAIWRDIVAADPDVALKDSHVTEVRKAMQRERYLPAPPYERWRDDRQGDFVRVENGIVDLNRITLLPHSREWFSCTKLPFAYDPYAECPEFMAFLGSLWEHMPDQVDALQQWFGYMLSRDTSQQLFAMLLGPSRSGKGTILRVMNGLLGDQNVMATTVNAMGSPFGLGNALDKKLIVIGDAHDGTREASNAAAEVIKGITGEDTIRIERKYYQAQDVRLTAKIVIAANQMPKLVDLKSSIINRMLLFRFTKSFAGREDLGLSERLRLELPGILNWAIVGLEKLKANGRLLRPESSEAKLAELQESMNPVDSFVGEFVGYTSGDPMFGDAVVMHVDEAYQVYRLWCGEAGHKACAKSKFSSAVGDFFASHPDVERKRHRKGGTINQTFFTNLKLLVSLDHYRALVSAKEFPAGHDEPDGSDEPDDDSLF